jgi:hypothetical protein
MKTTSLAKIERQIALPLHKHATGIATDPRTRAAIVMVLARLLLESAETSARIVEVRDEP